MSGGYEDDRKLLLTKTYKRYNSITDRQHDDRVSLHVERPIYQQDDLNRETQYAKPSLTIIQAVRNKTKHFNCLSCLYHTIPALKWLPSYRWKRDFLSDMISGITIAIMNIPQGMAYGLLGNLSPVVGIYMAFFPVLVYFIFGTSRHVSMGTFAVVCLMTGKVVNEHTTGTVEITQNGTYMSLKSRAGEPQYTNIQVATTVTFAVGMFELIMYVFRLGIISTLLSETLVNSFTCASAFHVMISQVKDLLGVPIGKRKGMFRFVHIVWDAIKALPQANRSAVIISTISCVVLSLNNELLKPWLATKMRMPIPAELIAVVIGTTASYFGDFQHVFNVTTVGPIPTGLPDPALPAFDLLPHILLDSFYITVVTYSVSLSMALVLAKKDHYEVNANQELLAQGLSNTFGSFFSCMPITASLSRSVIQQAVGGVTQLASVVSCLILLVTLLWIGPLLETLPKCVLASTIVVALKSMLMKCTMIKIYWRLSKWDALVWLVTFFTTVIVEISIGLAAGIVVSLFSLFIQGYIPYSCLLGVVPNTDLYLDIKRYQATQEIPHIKIFHYSGGLCFASRAVFQTVLFRKVGFDPNSVLSKRFKLEESRNSMTASEQLLTQCVILDFSALTYVDPSGVQLLRQLKSDYGQLNIEMYIAGCSGPVYEKFKKCDKWEGKQSKFMIFPTVHDAVLYAQANVLHLRVPNGKSD